MRSNLRKKECPLCLHQFSLGDLVYPVQGFSKMFGYEDIAFYGGNVSHFTKATCCMSYILYWKEEAPSYKLVDIEPEFPEKLIKGLDDKINMLPKPKENEVKTPIEAKKEVIEDKKDKLPSEMQFFELKKYIKDKHGKIFDKSVKAIEVREWLSANE